MAGLSWDDLVGGIGDMFTTDGGDLDIGTLLSILGGVGGAQGWFDSDQDKVGYQGGIPRYEAVRSAVPNAPDPNRRPGSSGQRYFSDTVFAQHPGAPIPTAEQARAMTQDQAGQLALQNMSGGGLATLPNGYYMGGTTDGMGDKVPASIGGQQPAALSDGEFVVPADVVGHLGNGNSQAGAKELYDMMERIRQARTGKATQAKQINPSKYLA
jgi:hypothetical protein